MNKDRKIDPEKIHLVKLQTIKGTLDNEAYGEDASVKAFDYNFDASIGVNAQERIVGVKLLVEIKVARPGTNELALVASYTHELVFVIDNLYDFTDPIENQPEPKVDRLMLGTLVGVAYSTVRGIIFNRTQGTKLQGILLPVIDPKKLVKQEEQAQPATEVNKTE
jgi:hypothetical protein